MEKVVANQNIRMVESSDHTYEIYFLFYKNWCVQNRFDHAWRSNYDASLLRKSVVKFILELFLSTQTNNLSILFMQGEY